MVPAFQLREIVREARSRTGVPGVAAGLLANGVATVVADGVLELGRDDPVRPDTPFRIASISKPFTASLALSCLPCDERLTGWLSHTGGLRCESQQPLPGAAEGLFSYSNAGYWAAGAACTAACGVPFEQAMREGLLGPLGLAATGYEEPPAPARGHAQQGETGHRPVSRDVYPPERHPSGGLWSTAGDLLAFAAHQLGGPGPLDEEVRTAMRQPRSPALGAGYGLGWWVREEGGRLTLDHEGSVAGYQSLLLLVPEERLALAVLTNSWRGSGLVRHVVERLGLVAASAAETGARHLDLAGRYVLDGAEATVEAVGDGLRVREAEVDPVTGDRIERPRFSAEPCGDGVYAYAGGVLMSHRARLPAPGLCADRLGRAAAGGRVTAGRRCRPPCHRRRRRRDPRRRRVGRGRRRRGRARLLRRRDGHDRAARRRPRDPSRRRDRRGAQPRLLLRRARSRRAGARGGARPPRRAVRRGARPLRGRPRLLCRAGRPGRTRTRSGATHGRLPWARLVRAGATARTRGRATCRRRTPPASRCSRPS